MSIIFLSLKLILSKARENFLKNTKAHRAQKDISEALQQFHRIEFHDGM